MMEYVDRIIEQEWINKLPAEVLEMDVTEWLKNEALQKEFNIPLKYKELNGEVPDSVRDAKSVEYLIQF